MSTKPQNPARSMIDLDGATLRISDLRGKAYETITLNPDYTVTEVMAAGYVPNAMMDDKADLLCLRLRAFALKHSPYEPDPVKLLALFVYGVRTSRNPAKRKIEAPAKKRG